MASWIEIAYNRGTCIGGRVEAYVASWIEMLREDFFRSTNRSRLMWPRGLKYPIYRIPIAGTIVEAYVASWIEMHTNSGFNQTALLSRLIRPRGLK